MAEGDGLLIRCTGLPRTEGSNPSLSATPKLLGKTTSANLAAMSRLPNLSQVGV